MKLTEWAGQPQTHIVGLFVSLLAALAVVAVIIGTLEYTKTRGQLLLTAFLVCGYFLTMLAATGIPQAGPGLLRLRPAALALATASLLLLLTGLWGTPDSNGFWKVASILTLLALGLALTGLALGRGAADRAVDVLAWASAALSTLLTVMAGLGIALEIRTGPYWWAFVLLTLCWLGVSAAILGAWCWKRKGRPS